MQDGDVGGPRRQRPAPPERHGTGHAVTDGPDAATVVRRRLQGADGLAPTAEARLLEVVAAHVAVPVPRVLRILPDQQAMEMVRVPGVPLLEWLDAHPAPPAALVERWADAIGRLHAALAEIPEQLVEGVVPRDETSPVAYLGELEPLDARARDLLGPGVGRAVDRFLDTPPPPGPDRLRLCHGDLGAEHVFVDPGSAAVTGVIDWSDAAVTDPALDVGLVLRDLGPRARDRVAAHLGGADAGLPARATFYARARALEDLQFGVDHDLPVYRRNAARALEALFAGSGTA